MSTNSKKCFCVVRCNQDKYNATQLNKEVEVNGIKFTVMLDPINAEGILVSEADRDTIEQAIPEVAWCDISRYSENAIVYKRIVAYTKDAVKKLDKFFKDPKNHVGGYQASPSDWTIGEVALRIDNLHGYDL